MLILPQMQKLDTSKIDNWPNDVFLGFAEISETESLDILTEKERSEFEGFVNPKRKAEFLSARNLFHFLIKELKLNGGPVKLLKKDTGKPYAKFHDKIIYVSFSHSPEKVFCAVSLQIDIGLDVEHTHRNINEAVVKRILNEHEWNIVGEEDPIRLWTIKEATVKCLGTGLRTNFRDLTIIQNKKKHFSVRFSVRFNDDKLFEICSFKQLNHQIALAYQSQHS